MATVVSPWLLLECKVLPVPSKTVAKLLYILPNSKSWIFQRLLWNIFGITLFFTFKIRAASRAAKRIRNLTLDYIPFNLF